MENPTDAHKAGRGGGGSRRGRRINQAATGTSETSTKFGNGRADGVGAIMSANVYPDTLTHTADQHWVVNSARSYIKSVPGKGRGVFGMFYSYLL